jgi:heterodisulfide reductase subunit B
VHSLSDDDLIHQVAPVRDLIRAMEQGSDTVVTLCSMCYNTLARANRLMREDDVKRGTINAFMDEERDYAGEVEVVHFLTFLRDRVGWETLRSKVKKPLAGMKVAPYYGCTLLRPREVAIEATGHPTLMKEFLSALGAEAVDFADKTLCCGSYQILAHPEAALDVSGRILQSALDAGADSLILTCPLCEFNLGKTQKKLLPSRKISREVPVYYFTQLLAVALGLDDAVCRFDLSDASALEFLKCKKLAGGQPQAG